MSQEELVHLQQLALAPAPELYHGKGFALVPNLFTLPSSLLLPPFLQR